MKASSRPFRGVCFLGCDKWLDPTKMNTINSFDIEHANRTEVP